ncbi:methyltransferase family protein [Candidatus Omnitrophota bacterium]
MGNKFLIKNGAVFFRLRNFLFPTFIIVLFLFTKPALFLGSRALDPVVVTLGFMIALTGQAFRLLVIGFAYIKRGGRDGRVFADDLVIQGFYAHVRNPMYVGNFLILLGIGMIYGSAWVYFVLVPFISFAYLSIVVTEEDYLKKRFGAEYKKYCKKVNRFFPNFKGIKGSLGQFQYDWKKVIRKDYGTFFGMIVGCYAIVLWKRYHLYGFPKSEGEILTAISVFILLGIGYVVVRRLKKSGKLKKKK